MSAITRKVAVITNIPTPYRIPLFNSLNDLLASAGLELVVIFATTGYKYRKWKIDMNECRFRYEVLGDKPIVLGSEESITFQYSGITSKLRELDPCVVVCNAFSPATVKIWFSSFFRRTNYVIWSGAIAGRFQKKISFARKMLRKMLIRRASGFIAYGTRAKQYLVDHGARPKAVAIAYNTVDTDYFLSEKSDAFARIRTGASDVRLLYVGHLTEGKRLDLLLHVVKKLNDNGQEANLRVLGVGDQLDSLAELASSLGISGSVSFDGFANRSEVRRAMGAADIFMFPSEYDIWGLVVVEAMCVGLPCIVSAHAGVAEDLVVDRETGYVADFENISELCSIVDRMVRSPDESANIGQRARQLVAKCASMDSMANSFATAIQRVSD